jgi:hypothetical protein
VMHHASETPHGFRLRAMIVMLWRGGLRVHEALALSKRGLDPRRGSVLVRRGKGGHGREVGMDAWGWEQLRPWLASDSVEIGPSRRPLSVEGSTFAWRLLSLRATRGPRAGELIPVVASGVLACSGAGSRPRPRPGGDPPLIRSRVRRSCVALPGWTGHLSARAPLIGVGGARWQAWQGIPNAVGAGSRGRVMPQSHSELRTRPSTIAAAQEHR